MVTWARDWDSRKGAWLALGLRVEGERVRLLGLHAHEGSGAEAGAVREESLRSLLEWALSRYVRGQKGEVTRRSTAASPSSRTRNGSACMKPFSKTGRRATPATAR